MSKIQKIKMKNFKALDALEVDFNGCTAIITAGNNKGKTSFLKGIVERIRFVRPDVILKTGTKEGAGELILDTGEIFRWEFDNNGKDKLMFFSKNGLKQSVTKELGELYFPPVFDVDKFLNSPPKKQAELLQLIVGIDFAEIDQKYKIAYDSRTSRNSEVEKIKVKLNSSPDLTKCDFVDLEIIKNKREAEKNRLNKLYLENKSANEKERKTWQNNCEILRENIFKFNELQKKNGALHCSAVEALDILESIGYAGLEVENFCEKLKRQIEEEKTYVALPEPNYIVELPDSGLLTKLENDILTANEINQRASKYFELIELKKEYEKAVGEAKLSDDLVKSVFLEKNKMIESANFPQGISITNEGIEIDGLPFNKEQISTSLLYITALKIASMKVGEVRTLYFDASSLDKNNLLEIQKWANENDLQLLIERPDYDGGEIQHEIIENQNE